MKFTEIDFAPELLDSLDAMNFNEMTPIQEQAIPAILDGKDLIACAQTGTGKTAAFMLPVLSILCDYPGNVKNRVLVIVPTRELAIQIEKQIQGFSYYLGVSSVSVYGGNNTDNWNTQRRAMTTGVDVIVTTPGRFLQHLNLEYLDLSGIEFLILDEADRMLDMGFLDDIQKISSFLPKSRQTLMFSATMPRKIRDLAVKLLHEPIEISIEVSKPAEKIEQRVFSVYDSQKLGVVQYVLSRENFTSVLIFSSTKSKVKEITQTLKRKKLSVREIHSDLDQQEREETLRLFRNRQVTMLVATDILSRGIDIDKIELVINYDVPPDPEDYVHRIGRTARAEQEGMAVTLVNEKDQQKFNRIEALIERELVMEKLPPELGEGPEYRRNHRKGGGGGGGKKHPRYNNRNLNSSKGAVEKQNSPNRGGRKNISVKKRNPPQGNA